MNAAVERLQPALERDFAASYSALVLDHDTRTLVVCRKPDPALDAWVRSRVKDVQVDLRPARFSLRELQALAKRVLADSSYWRERGVQVTGVGPKPDGSGIEVMTSTGAAGERERFEQRYGVDAFTVQRGEAVLARGERWTPMPTAR